ncbi:MAG TPA: FliM/FliN family flagellar motor switch protein [Candidatus Aquilonibacter sp.]|nr:FliM/FliN family flagellar motor switch protein [Candidatus Aquilonibacter sp.]
MEKILNQEEIDLLFKAAQGTASKQAPEQHRQIRPCDFHQAGELGKEQVRQVTMLHESFAPSVANSLGAYLRVGFQASLVAVEQINYSEFLSRLPEQTYFTTVQLNPMEELAVIQLDLAIVFPMIDLLLGGPGQPMAEPRDLTEIEEQIMEIVVAIVCRELQTTWQPVLPVVFNVGQRQKQSQIVGLMSPGERVLNLSFEISLNDVRGLLNLAFPAVVSNALLRKLAAGMVQRRKPSAGQSERLKRRLMECAFTIDLDLCNVALRIGDIVDMQPGQVIRLRHSLNDPMFVAVNGRPVFTGLPVSCGPVRGGLIQEWIRAKETAKEKA